MTPDLKIFLVEDNDDTRNMLHELLVSSGFEVHTAGTMQAALATFAGTGSQVLLSDLGLPDGDGWALLKTLRAAGAEPYAVAMSGFGTLADRTASLEAGYRHHLVKPIDLDALERLLDDARHEIARHQGTE